MEKNNKLLAARDIILSYLMKENFSVEECNEIFNMCSDEINAAIKRMSIGEVRKDDE